MMNRKFNIGRCSRVVAMTGVAAVLAMAGAANAQYIDPARLQSSGDGFSTAVQQRLIQNGYTTSVGTSVPDYGDQLDVSLFAQCPDAESMTWGIAWTAAGNSPWHKIGYYTVTTPTIADITWVFGGANSGLPSTAMLSIAGSFGLALYSGNTQSQSGSDVFFIEATMNDDNFRHAAVLQGRNASGVMDCELLVSWEDLRNGGDRDYNDLGMRLQGVAVVPGPAAAVLFGMGSILIARRERRKAK